MTHGKPIHTDDLPAALDRVRAGTGEIHVPGRERVVVINAAGLKRHERVDRRLIWVAHDGRGFRIASGRNSVYVPAGNVFFIAR